MRDFLAIHTCRVCGKKGVLPGAVRQAGGVTLLIGAQIISLYGITYMFLDTTTLVEYCS